jgi:ferritin
MISKKMEEAINRQINAEIYSSGLYYAMAAHFESLSLKGFAKWLRIQALEELTHVHKFFMYVHDRGGKVVLGAVEAPPSDWDTPLKAFEQVYEHEVKVTSLINKLMDLAQAESDHATQNFLQWFIAEQVEEEASADEAVQQLRLVDKTEGGLFLLDQEMGKRGFVLPQFLAGVF